MFFRLGSERFSRTYLDFVDLNIFLIYNSIRLPGHIFNRGILVYTICLISIRSSVSDGATNVSLLNIERSVSR